MVDMKERVAGTVIALGSLQWAALVLLGPLTLAGRWLDPSCHPPPKVSPPLASLEVRHLFARVRIVNLAELGMALYFRYSVLTKCDFIGLQMSAILCFYVLAYDLLFSYINFETTS